MNDRPAQPRRFAFTLVELLVVIGIIALLIAILLPVASRVRTAAQATDTQSMIRAIDSAIIAYKQDQQAYPGPIPSAMLGSGKTVQFNKGGTLTNLKGRATGGFDGNGDTLKNVTGTENLVLGLLGGLVRDGDDVVYDPAAVGRGPTKLGTSPGGYKPYVDLQDSALSMHEAGDTDKNVITTAPVGSKWGRFLTAAGAADDSIIPEFLDRFSNAMPILYLRAEPTTRITDATAASVAGNDSGVGVYNQLEIAGYVDPDGPPIGEGASPQLAYTKDGTAVADVGGTKPYSHGLKLTASAANAANAAKLRDSMQPGASFTYPYDIRAYLLSPSVVNARHADSYVLISAGKDRVYGTEDDLTNFGSVLP